MNFNVNPFNIGFGEEPLNYIYRDSELNEIVNDFMNENPSSRIRIITGPRGCGKTVLLGKCKNYFEEQKNWLTVDLNQYSNLLEQLAAKIYEKGKVKKLFLNKEFSFSFHGLTITIKGQNPIANINTLLDKMFEYLKKKNIKILITIDDVSSSKEIKMFAQEYQHYLLEKFNVFLLMTGLYNNVENLINTKNLTFLLRAPKIFLPNLSVNSVSLTYKSIFNLNDQTCFKLASFTKGYPYAFQILGDLLYKNNLSTLNQDIINKFDMILSDNVYSKIWSSTSSKQRVILINMLSSKSIQEIMKISNMKNNEFSVYRDRLVKAGIVIGTSYGILEYTLPRFDEFIKRQNILK